MKPVLAAGPAPATPDRAHADLKKATQQFESYFLDLLLKEMRKTVPQSTLMGEPSQQQQIFRDMLDQTLADTMSRRGDFGMGRMMYEQLSPSLGPATGPAAPSRKETR